MKFYMLSGQLIDFRNGSIRLVCVGSFIDRLLCIYVMNRLNMCMLFVLDMLNVRQMVVNSLIIDCQKYFLCDDILCGFLWMILW